MLAAAKSRRRNRFDMDPSNRQIGAFAVATSTVSANKWAIAFSVPVVVRSLPTDWKVNGAAPTAWTLVDPQHITLTFAVNVAAGQTYVIPPGSLSVRTSTGGIVAAAAGTF